MTASRDGKRVPSRSRKTRATTVAPMRARGGEGATVHADPVPGLASEERTRTIAEEAYYLAEARGFQPGHELEDWLMAERAVDERLAQLVSS